MIEHRNRRSNYCVFDVGPPVTGRSSPRCESRAEKGPTITSARAASGRVGRGPRPGIEGNTGNAPQPVGVDRGGAPPLGAGVSGVGAYQRKPSDAGIWHRNTMLPQGRARDLKVGIPQRRSIRSGSHIHGERDASCGAQELRAFWLSSHPQSIQYCIFQVHRIPDGRGSWTDFPAIECSPP